MVIIDIESNTSVGGLTLDPAGMHCPSWDDAFVSSCVWFRRAVYVIRSIYSLILIRLSAAACMLTKA